MACTASCAEGSSNPFGATAEILNGSYQVIKASHGGPALFSVTAQQDPNVVKRKAQAYARQWVTDCEFWQLATLTDEQQVMIDRLAAIRAELVPLEATTEMMKSKTPKSIRKMIDTRENEIKDLKTQIGSIR